MNINRVVADFGNSTCQFMINGHYFEMPSSIKEISMQDAKGLFSNDVSKESLHQQLVIKLPSGEEGCYQFFKVGESAKTDLLGNAHIHGLHDKTKSMTVWASFLGGLAYFHAMKHPELDKDTIEIGYFGTLLPIWLVKKANSFSEKLKAMEERFKSDVTFELITAGFQRELTIKVDVSKCRVEGETARFALKYDLELNEKDDLDIFNNAYVVMDDIGGQSQDLVKLQPGLKKPQTASDFASVTDQSFLNVLETLRTDKLMDYFNDVRSLEIFIWKNASKREYIYTNPITHKTEDLTDFIEPYLHEFAKVAMEKTLQTFHFSQGDSVYYMHIGGVNQVLKFYMIEYLRQKLGAEITDMYHIFPEDSRKFNIHASEIVAKSELKRLEATNNG